MDLINFFTGSSNFRVIGSRCTLKPLTKKDLPKIEKWFSDLELLRFAFGIIADDSVLDKISKEYLVNFFNTSTEILGIWTPDSILVGFINYSAVTYKDYYGRIGIIIGEETDRSKGLGTYAMNLALFYLFDRVGLDRVELDTAHFNTRAQRCFEKCGFVKTGERTDINFLNGEIVHKHLMEIDREDFMENLDRYFDELPVFQGRLSNMFEL